MGNTCSEEPLGLLGELGEKTEDLTVVSFKYVLGILGLFCMLSF